MVVGNNINNTNNNNNNNNQTTNHYEQDGYMFDVYNSQTLERVTIKTPTGIVLNIEQKNLVPNNISYGLNYRQVPKGCFFRSRNHILLAMYEHNMGKYKYLQINDGYDYGENYDLTMEQLINSTTLLVEIPNIPKMVFFRTMLVCDIDEHENFPEYDDFVNEHGAEHGYNINEGNTDPTQQQHQQNNNNSNNPTLNGGKRRKTRKAKKSKKSKKTRRYRKYIK